MRFSKSLVKSTKPCGINLRSRSGWDYPRSSPSVREEHVQTILLSHEEVAQQATQLYENSIRPKVETQDNIGKMVIIM